MAGMSRHSSAAALQGFSIFQPALGAALLFLPALGTAELDSLIDAFLPGPASLKDKRATVCMDFCEYARQTGETIKFYAVYPVAAADSPASSMYDSGYGSNFNASPDMNWGPSASFATPRTPSTAGSARAQARSTSERKSSVASSRTSGRDFSHLPGMKIMTKDGLDVTNSASRGCKTKEQRDHAHLMRIIKACDACRRKKIRCDPAHRKRTASQAQSPSEPKSAKKAKKAAAESPVEFSMADADLTVTSASFPSDEASAAPLFDLFDGGSDNLWDQFVQYDDPMAQAPYSYDFFSDPEGHFTPSSASSTSPSQPFTPADPAPSSLDSYTGTLVAQPDTQAATLPYLTSGGHGTNYLDFNLYSPASSVLDEELQQFQTEARVNSKQQSTRPSPPGESSSWNNHNAIHIGGLEALQASSPQDESYFCGCSNDPQQPRESVHIPDPGWGVPGVPRLPDELPGARTSLTGTTTWATATATIVPQRLNLQTPVSPATQNARSTSQAGSPLRLTRGIRSTRASDSMHLQSTNIVGHSDPVAMSLAPLPQVKRCGKDGPMSASSSPLPSTACSDVVHSSVPAVTRILLTSQPALSTNVLGLADDKRQDYRPAALRTLPDSTVPSATVRSSPMETGVARDGVSTHSLNSEQDQRRTGAALVSMSCFSAQLVSTPTPSTLRPLGVSDTGSYAGVPQGEVLYGAAPGAPLLSPFDLVMATILLLYLPIRQLVDGAWRKSDSSSLPAFLVGFGLVTLMSAFIMQSQSPVLISKLPTFVLWLAPMAIRHRAHTPLRTSSTSVSSSGLAKLTIDNVKSKIQRSSSKLHHVRCMLSRRLSNEQRKASLKQVFSP